MNKKQEALLWLSGLLLSWWIYIRLDFYEKSQSTATLHSLDYKNHGSTMNVWMYLSGKLEYAVPLILQLAIPLIIITGLVFMSLRTRKK